jgi:hypothetical protein
MNNKNFIKFFLTIIIVLLITGSIHPAGNCNLIELSDSTVTASSVEDTSKYLDASKFTYAGQRLYVMNGELPLKETQIRPITASIIGSIYVASIIGLHIHQRNAWWSGQRGNFHFEEDWISALQVDKCGHSYGGYLMAYYTEQSLMASGVNWDDAYLYGAIGGALYQTYVESEDGFSKAWGFSPTDFYFDVIGPIYFLAQHYVPALQNITPKWQYVPTQWSGRPQINRPSTPIDDYNASTFWYSIKVYNFLPDDCKKYWPKWLNIAIGYGADADVVSTDPNIPPDELNNRRYTIGLDYDLVDLLPDGGWFWNWLRQDLNFIKFPSPAVEFSKSGTKFYIAYPFQIKI